MTGKDIKLHWPVAVLASAWLLILGRVVDEHVFRATLAVASVGLMMWQWNVYRRRVSGARFVYLSLVVSGFLLGGVLLAANVVSYYSYAPESDPWLWPIAIDAQKVLLPVILALMLVVGAWSFVYAVQWLAGVSKRAWSQSRR